MAGSSLHEHAVNAEKELEQLATGLAQANAQPQAVQAVTKMAEMIRKLVKVLGRGQEQTGNQEPPAPSQQQGPAPQGAQAPQQQGPVPHGAPAAQQPATLDSATGDLHQQRVQEAVARRQGLQQHY